MRLMQSLIRAGHMAADALPECLAFAQGVMDNPNSSDRDRLRASELINAVAFKAADVAVDADKIDRLNSGQATENVSVFQVVIPEARERV